MKAGIRAFALSGIAAVALTLALAGPAQGVQGGGAGKGGGCGLTISEQRNLGISGTYVTLVKGKNIDCGKAKKLTAKFHECRKANGGRDGKCGGFKGYSCSQRILDSSPAQYNAKAKCTKGSKKLVTQYTQST